MADCVFCRIAAGEIPSHVVGRNEHAFAFLDANPLTEGHALVIPRKHYEHLQDIPEAEAVEWFRLIHVLAGRLQEAAGAEAMTIGLNNGRAAGQAVPHAHMHLVPRYSGDGGGTVHSIVRQEGQRPPKEVYERIRSQLGG